MTPGQKMVWAAVFANAWDRQRKRAYENKLPEGWEAVAVQAAANSAGKAVMALASNLDAVAERYGKGSWVDRFAQEVGADPLFADDGGGVMDNDRPAVETVK